MRRRRFIVAVIAVGLVFGITLLLDGFTASLHNEIDRTVAAFNGDAWAVGSGSSGPFTPDHLFAESASAPLLKDPGVKSIAPILALGSTIDTKKTGIIDVNVIGTADPVALASGHWPASAHQLVANDDLGLGIGSTVTISKERFTVVGTTRHLRYFAGTNILFLRLVDAQRVFVFGQKLATGFVVHGSLPSRLPKGLSSMTNAQVAASLRRPVKVASSTIGLLDILLWLVAAGIIGTILYMTALERLRDFAALKAIGARNHQLFTGIAAQALVLSISAGLVAVIASRLLKPFFEINIEIPFRSYPLTIGVAIAVGLLGSIAGVSKAMAIDPALAFGG